MRIRISEQVATDLKQGRSERSIAEELAASEGWNDETALEFVININLAEVAKHKTKPRHVVLECIAGFGGLLCFFGVADWIASHFGYDITGIP